MMTVEDLCEDEWVVPGAQLRMLFRRDGSGFYERKDGDRLRRENLIWKLDPGLRIKFARARGWEEVPATVRAGKGGGARVGQREMVLAFDPYAKAMEDRITGELVLQSDEGGELPAS
jgi:hypothetical protein